MKHKYALILSIFAIISPICAVAVMFFTEPELVEAILGGLLIGCAVGSIFGAVSLVINKWKNKVISVLSIIPMCPLVIYLLLLIPYLISR